MKRSIDSSLIIVSIKELLKLLEQFVQPLSPLGVAGVIRFGRDVPLNVLHVVKWQVKGQSLALDDHMSTKLFRRSWYIRGCLQVLSSKGYRQLGSVRNPLTIHATNLT